MSAVFMNIYVSVYECQCSQAVLSLFLSGVNVDMQCRFGCTALYEAAISGHFNVVKDLIHYKADLDLCTTKGSTPLLGLYTSRCPAVHYCRLVNLLLKKKKCLLNWS